MINSYWDIVALILVSIIVGYFGASILLYIYDSINKKLYPQKYSETNVKNESKKRLIVIAILVVSLYIGYSTMKNYWGTKTIGSLFALNKYETQYYVNLFPDKNNAKNYRVKADIIADFKEWEDTDNDGNSHTKSKRVYYLKKVYFNNGGYLTFKNELEQDDDDNSLEFNTKVLLQDDKGTDWYIELTNEKVN